MERDHIFLLCAIYFLQQILIYDPTNPDAQKYIDALKKSKEKKSGSGSNGSKTEKDSADKTKGTGSTGGKK